MRVVTGLEVLPCISSPTEAFQQSTNSRYRASAALRSGDNFQGSLRTFRWSLHCPGSKP